MLETLAPNARGRALADIFDGRASPERIMNWKAGRRGIPQWAADLLRDKLAQKHARELTIAAQIKTGPGKRAGAINLAEYLARRR